MRRPMLDDLMAGARRLACAPSQDRQGLADQLVFEAHAAHHFAKRLGRPHPRWGNGSLMTRALSDGLPQKPGICFHSMAIMAAAIDSFRHDRAK